MTARIERPITSGTFQLVCTHAHNDHVNAAPAPAARHGAPILLRTIIAASVRDRLLTLPTDTTVHTGGH